MDNQRLFLFIALSLVIMLLWDAWQRDFVEPPPASSVATSSVEAESAPLTPDLPDVAVPGAEAVPADMSKPSVPAEPAESAKAVQPVAASGQKVRVRTDVIDLLIDTAGGDFRQLDLLEHSVSVDRKDQATRLFNDQLPDLYIAQSGLISGNAPAPDHHAVFTVPQTDYVLADGQKALTVPLTWTHESGLKVTKLYTFSRGSYVIDVNVQVENRSASAWAGRIYRQLQRTKVAEKGQSSFIYTYMGAVVSSSYNKYEKVKFEDMADWKPQESYVTGGWAAMLQHYFIGAWIPDAEESNHYYAKSLGSERFIIGLTSEQKTIAAGSNDNFHTRLFVGPKEQNVLEEVAPNLDLTVDYGFLTVIAKPLYWVLSWLHQMLGNWGWSIIILTMMIKLVFYKLSEASYRSMAKMRKFQPKIMALRERYGNDKQRMSQAMMDLYKKEKINPLGGCLPILVQIPVFIALYWVLLESVELRQAEFIFWISDLSTKDPYYVLPVLMGLSMFIQQKLNPAPMEPMQQKILMALPVVFTFFFMFFPSGLVLYWVVNNVLSIAQQWYITRKIEQAG